MDFAKKQLEKYGWREGKGLGKNEDGISVALKPKLKFDNAGVGHQAGKDFTNNWWERVYSSALDNVQVDAKEGQVKLQVKDEDAVEITTKNYSVKELKKKSKDCQYQGTFLKSAKLTQTGVIALRDSENDPVPEFKTDKFKPLTDEELFAACGGRTAHKGARHGLKLSGKLSRIEKQEKILLKKLKNVSLNDNRENIEKKIKKISKSKEKLGGDIEDNINLLSLDDYDSRSSGSATPKKKSKHRKKRSVSFSETVTAYTTHDVDVKTEASASDSEQQKSVVVVKMVKIKEEPNNKKEEDGNDEGIEQDCDTPEDNSNHKSFELAQSKKLAKSKKHDRATARFLRKLAEHKKRDESHTIEECQSCKKRKMSLNCDIKNAEAFIFEEDDVPSSKKAKVQEQPQPVQDKKKEKMRKKHRKKCNRDIKSITKSLDKKCRISESE